MKTLKLLVIFAIPFCIYQNASAQTLNWESLENTRHVITAGFGWDYSISYSLGYGYQLKTNMPIMLTTQFSIPSGDELFDDLKTKIGGQVLLLNTSELKGSIALNGIYRRYENPLVLLKNFGSELKGTFGYYKPRWFVAAEVGFDQAIVTHFKHSDSYKETIYAGVKDGWYKPTTGGNFQYGVQTGYSFVKSDLTFSIGTLITQDFKSTPLIPYYLNFGYNYRIN